MKIIVSLSAALAVLLLVNPFAAADISLQLSFSAMLGIVLFFAAWAVVVSVFNASGQLFEKQLDEETHHNRCSNLEVDAGCDKTVGFIAKEDVRNEIDEA